MSYATGTLLTNNFRIRNAAFGTYATIEGSGDGVNVQGSGDDDSASVEWHIDTTNGNSTVTSRLYGQCTAYTTATPSSGDFVTTGAGKSYKWTIRETHSTPGQYVIFSSANDTLFWGLTSPTATVKMTHSFDANSQWKFQYL